MRISLNSVRKECYNAYFRPQSYSFSDVLQGIDMGLGSEIFVSINYLNCPGFTDTEMLRTHVGDSKEVIDAIGGMCAFGRLIEPAGPG